jgi:hypothetical protein
METILEDYRYLNENLTDKPMGYSSEGPLEFWSSGGLLREVTNDDSDEYDAVSLTPKHIRVTSIIEGQVAVAHYYAEGSMQPKGFPAVSHYMTRASVVSVNEGGKWKIRSARYSPVAAGSGTTQTVQ